MSLRDLERPRPAEQRPPTLDDLFRRAVERRPNAAALADPPDRQRFTDGAPRHLTYAEADAAVSALAARLLETGLAANSVVALQLPNTVESVIALLGVLRAGLIAAPLPLLWRRSKMAEALQLIGARALITCRRIGTTDHGEIAMHVAADVFAIRFVCAFGPQPPDGVAGLDDVFALPDWTSPFVSSDVGDAAGQIAIVTFDVGPDGLIPVPRSHSELIAGGLAVALESRIGPNSSLLGALTTASFAGLATTVLPWLFSAGTLSLHQPFDPAVFAQQWEATRFAIVPAPLVRQMSNADALSMSDKTIIGLWRWPERHAEDAPWSAPSKLVDVLAFGEIGIVAAARAENGIAAPLRLGPITAPRGVPGANVLIDIGATEHGTLALGGSMVPQRASLPGMPIDSALCFKAANGFADTFQPCRVATDGTIELDGPPAGIVNVGGYRFASRELQDIVTDVADDSTVVAVPDPLAANRLAGIASNPAAVREALAQKGADALIVEAFEEGRPDSDRAPPLDPGIVDGEESA